MFEKITQKFSKNLKWYEISSLKLSVVFFTLFIITVLPMVGKFVLNVAWYWYLLIALLFAVPIIKKIM